MKNKLDDENIKSRQMLFFKTVGISVDSNKLSKYLDYAKELLLGEDIRVRTVIECLFSLNNELYPNYEDVLTELKKLFRREDAKSVTYGTIIKYRDMGIKNIKQKIIERKGSIPNTLSKEPYDYVGNVSRIIDLLKEILKSNGIDDQDMVLKIANLVTYEDLTIYIARYPLDGSGPEDWSIVAKLTGVTSHYAVKKVETVSKILYEVAGIEQKVAQKDKQAKTVITKKEDDTPYLVKIYGTEDIAKIKEALENLSIVGEEQSKRIKEIIISLYPIDGSTPKTKEEIMTEYGINRNQLIGIVAAGLSRIRKYLKPLGDLERPKIWVYFGTKTEEELNEALNKLSYRERRLFYAMHSDLYANMSNEEKAKTLGMEEMEFLAQYRIVREKLKLIINLKLDFSKEELEKVKRVVNQLDVPLERQVLVLALGLNGTYNSIESIAKEIKKPVEYTQKLIEVAISHIKDPIKSKLGGIIR